MTEIVPRSVHIMDPQLISEGGHYLSHDRRLIAELDRRGISVTLHVRHSARLPLIEAASVREIFSRDIFDEVATDSIVWAMENFHTLNSLFMKDLMKVPGDISGSDDLVYFPNVLQNQIYGIANWLGTMPAPRRPCVGIMLRFLNHAMSYVAQRANKSIIVLYYRFAIRQLLRVQPRTLICADTRELAAEYRNIIGVPVIELPNPMDVSALTAVSDANRSRTGGRPVIMYQGHTSPLRGFHFLPEIIEATRNHASRPRYVIQIQSPEKLVELKLAPFHERLKSLQGDDVVLVYGALPQAEYLNMLIGADIVLLPYSPKFYGFGSSGVFSEAASIGKVVVVSEGTVPAREGREFELGVAVATEWTSTAMAEATLQALDHLPSLKEKSTNGAAAYRQVNCARTLWDRVFSAIAFSPEKAK